VADYRLSRLALADLKAIALYTRQTWGLAQAQQYLAELEEMILRLASNSHLGRACDEIRKGYRRIEQRRHVLFYRVRRSSRSAQSETVEIIRILHARMLPGEHLGEE